MKSFARARLTAGEPRLDGGMRILVSWPDDETATRDCRQRATEAAPKPTVFGAGDQAGGAETLDMAQASEHIP